MAFVIFILCTFKIDFVYNNICLKYKQLKYVKFFDICKKYFLFKTVDKKISICYYDKAVV